jgi:hypothetical protein
MATKPSVNTYHTARIFAVVFFSALCSERGYPDAASNSGTCNIIVQGSNNLVDLSGCDPSKFPTQPDMVSPTPTTPLAPLTKFNECNAEALAKMASGDFYDTLFMDRCLRNP